MKVVRYYICQHDSPDQDVFDHWKITVDLKPTWFDRIILGKHCPEIRTMIGSCRYWRWENGERFSPFWMMWAVSAILYYRKSHKSELNS
jgi:hypothetical protein